MCGERQIRAFGLIVLAALAAGCESATGPEEIADFQSALEGWAALDAVLGSPSWAGFAALGGRTPFGRRPAAVGGAAGVAGMLGMAAVADRAPIISDSHRGVTFVYDPATDEYAPDRTRAGAPPTGVRFIVYEVDGSGRPLPAREIGYADLVDEGDRSAEDIVLRLTVVVGRATILDYRTSLDDGPAGGALTVRGFLQGDGDRLDFVVSAASARTRSPAEFEATFEMRIDARSFRITGSVAGIEGQEPGALEVHVGHGGDAMAVQVERSASAIEGVFVLNGERFATVSGDPAHPTVVGRSGAPLTGPEQLVLHRMLDTTEDVFDFLEDLVDPVDDLVLMGAIL